MKVLTNLKQATSYSTLHVFSDFPAIPQAGMLVLRDDGILYIYSEVEGTATWRPLNVKTKTYVHTQGSVATTWNITHNLGTQNIIFFIYDTNNDRQFEAGVSFPTDDTMSVSFTEGISGKAVIFAEGDSYASGSGSGTYTLPTASATTLGGIKIGSGLSIDGSGVVTASGGSGSGNLTAYQFRIIDWSTISNGTVPANKLTFSANCSNWTLTKVDETRMNIVHNLNKRVCGHDVMKGDGEDNLSYPPSTLRTLEHVDSNTIQISGYMNMEDLYITLFFMS